MVTPAKEAYIRKCLPFVTENELANKIKEDTVKDEISK